jgi:hypothetical protein
MAMKAVIQMDLKTSSPTDAQQKLMELCEKLKQDGSISSYHFEIETESGSVTEICVLANQKVIA